MATELLSTGVLVLGGLVTFWFFGVFWKTLKTPEGVIERNRSSVGSFSENFLGENPASHDMNSQEMGEVFIPSQKVASFDKLPAGESKHTARLSSHFIEDVLRRQ